MKSRNGKQDNNSSTNLFSVTRMLTKIIAAFAFMFSSSILEQVLTNVVFKIYEGAYERLTTNGELWVVIQKKQGAPSSKEKLISLFGNCEIVNRDRGYYILKSVKN